MCGRRAECAPPAAHQMGGVEPAQNALFGCDMFICPSITQPDEDFLPGVCGTVADVLHEVLPTGVMERYLAVSLGASYFVFQCFGKCHCDTSCDWSERLDCLVPQVNVVLSANVGIEIYSIALNQFFYRVDNLWATKIAGCQLIGGARNNNNHQPGTICIHRSFGIWFFH